MPVSLSGEASGRAAPALSRTPCAPLPLVQLKLPWSTPQIASDLLPAEASSKGCTGATAKGTGRSATAFPPPMDFSLLAEGTSEWHMLRQVLLVKQRASHCKKVPMLNPCCLQRQHAGWQAAQVLQHFITCRSTSSAARVMVLLFAGSINPAVHAPPPGPPSAEAAVAP